MSDPLLIKSDRKMTPMQVLINFTAFAVGFSLNHGCVTSVLSLASSELKPISKELGGYGSGTLYVCYTATAFLAAAPIVNSLGHKWSMVSALGLYCCYVFSFLIAFNVGSAENPGGSWAAVEIGAVLGGFAAGWLWTAQGGYFTKVSKAYAEAAGIESDQATSYLSGIFATLYVGGEAAMKGLSYVLTNEQIVGPHARTIAFVTFPAIAVASAAACVFIDDFSAYNEPKKVEGNLFGQKLLLATNFMVEEPKIMLMAGTQVAFGFMAAFVTYYVNGFVVTPYLGVSANGLLGLVIAGTATGAALPLSAVSAKFGKQVVISLGALVYLIELVVYLSYTAEQMGSWGRLVPMYILHGLGRAVWEGTNKAVIADYFPGEKSAGAFANVVLQSGLSSAIGFFAFPHATQDQMVITCLVFVILGIVTYWISYFMHAAEQRRELSHGDYA